MTTDEQLHNFVKNRKAISVPDLKSIVIARLIRKIYKAAIYFEDLEHCGLIDGNGHHIAQDIANYAVKILEERWV